MALDNRLAGEEDEFFNPTDQQFLSDVVGGGGNAATTAAPLFPDYVIGLGGVRRPVDPLTGLAYQTEVGGAPMLGWFGGQLRVGDGVVYEGDRPVFGLSGNQVLRALPSQYGASILHPNVEDTSRYTPEALVGWTPPTAPTPTPTTVTPAAASAESYVIDPLQFGFRDIGEGERYQTGLGNVQDYFNLTPLGDLSRFAQTQAQGEGEYTTRYKLPEFQSYLSEQGMELREQALPGNRVARWVQGPQGVVEGTYQEVDLSDKDFGIATALLGAAAGNIAPLGMGALNVGMSLDQGNIGTAALNLAKLIGVPVVGDTTKQISETLRSVVPDELLGSTRIADLASGVIDDVTKQTAAAAISGKKVDIGSAVVNSLLNQGLEGITKEAGVDPKTLTSGLKVAAGKGGLSDIYNLVSGGLEKISGISMEGLAPQQEIDRLLARYPASHEPVAVPEPASASTTDFAEDGEELDLVEVPPSAPVEELAGPPTVEELLERMSPEQLPPATVEDLIADLMQENIPIQEMPLEFVPSAMPETALSDEFISSLMPEDEVARSLPVTPGDVRSVETVETVGQRPAFADFPALSFEDIIRNEPAYTAPPPALEPAPAERVDITGKSAAEAPPVSTPEVIEPTAPAPAAQQIETVGKREEGLDQPLDIYLPELFGGPPALPGRIEGPSTVETVGKRPDEDLLAPLIDAGLEEEDQRARTEPTLPPGRIEGPSTVETVAKRPDEDLLSSLINAGLEEEDQRARTEPPARPGQLQGPSEIEVVGKREEDQPLDIYMSELFGGPPPRAGELQGPSTIDITGKRPVDLTPIDSVLDIDKIMREEVEIPNRPTPEEMAEKILPPVSPVLSPAPPPPSPTPRPVTPVSPPSTKTGGGFDLSGLMALLGMLAAQREGKEEAYQTANVAPGVESGLRAIEQMYGTRRG